MVIPTGFVVPLFLAAFVVSSVQYYIINPKRRVLNGRFALMVGGFIGAFSYPLILLAWRGNAQLPPLSFAYLGAGMLCLGVALALLRRMPRGEE